MSKHHYPYENCGYHIDFMVGNKYIGSVKTETPDRNVMGYNGRKQHYATEKITLGKKSIDKGQTYHTYCYPICGRMIAKDKLEQQQTIAQSIGALISNKIGI
jgi:hypothetical protein